MQNQESEPNKTIGIKAVLDKALQSYDKLPMLEIVLAKFIRQLTVAFRNFTSEPVEIDIVEFSSLRFGSFFKNINLSSSIVVFEAIEWENLGLLVLSNNLIFSFVDVLLGGTGNIAISALNTNHDRILTHIEQGIAKQMVEVLLSELGIAFEPVSPVSFSFERLENNPNFATICRPGDAVIILKAKVNIENRADTLELLIPYKTIEPVKAQMQQVFLGDTFGIDALWEEALSRTINKVSLPMEAVIINKPVLLQEVVNLKVGDTIIMDQNKNDDILLRSGHVELFKGQIGQVEGKVAISLTDKVPTEGA